jgi:DNA-binding GntR family transcriptional regulator
MTSAVTDLEPLERRTLGETIYGQLSELLISGRLAPGERLSLRDSAAVLGVSVMPVREAVSRLVADGALEVTPNRAVRVPVMTAAGFRELADTRMADGGPGRRPRRAAPHQGPPRRHPPRRSRLPRPRRRRGVRPRPLRRAQPGPALRRLRCLRPANAAGIIASLWLKAGPVINLDLRASPRRIQLGHARHRHADALAAIEAGDAAAAEAAIAGDIDQAASFIIARGVLPITA